MYDLEHFTADRSFVLTNKFSYTMEGENKEIAIVFCGFPPEAILVIF